MTEQEIRNNTLLLKKAFPDAVRIGENELRAVYTDDILQSDEKVTIDMRVDENGVARFLFSMTVKIKAKARKEVQLYLNRIRDRSEARITKAELMNNGRLLVMETWMEQTDEVESVEQFTDRCVGFFITLSLSFGWLEKMSAAKRDDA